ncbi:MAG: MarR family transcriptional regulator [Alphaproteobacteria bacterium]|nr:MAG: MarR family transcriptional regulator [Alphaproteobacteria bacterium]
MDKTANTAPRCVPAAASADEPEEPLAGARQGAPAIEALLAFDAEMFAWHRRMMKGDLPARLIADLGVDIELSQLHALTAIGRIERGLGRPRPEPATVGLLAEEMALDPSRASRIAAGLIDAGWVRREAHQGDARRSVIVLSEAGRALIAAFRKAKWARMLKVFEDWPEEDIVAFSRLFARYSRDSARVFGVGAPGGQTPPAGEEGT